MSLRERLDSLSRGELAGFAVVVVATLAGAGLWYSRSLPRPIQVTETTVDAVAGGPTATPSVTGGPSASVPPSVLIVDVAGWVRRPGVYEFDAGSRVVDAVERAGGARERADLTLLNLAAPLVDGQQVIVLKEGQVSAPGGSSIVSSGGGSVAGGLVNINTADGPTLETLNGVGPVLAAAIISFREENGPFTTVEQLEAVPGIGPATLAELRDQVTV
jgi:competence protein ComEA